MPAHRIYDGPSTTFAFRLSPQSRNLLDYLAARDGISPAHYMRDVYEAHLRALGFDLTPGVEAVADPDYGTPAGWLRDRTKKEGRV